MSSVQNLRELINERLTAAADEIFREFEKTIVQYEEEIDRQRKLLDNIWKPEIKLQITELPQQQIFKEEEVPTEQNVCNQERNSSVDQEDPEPLQIKEEQEEFCTNLDQEASEPPQIKEEKEELCNSWDRQQSGQTAAADMNQKTDSFMLVQCKSKCKELPRENFSVSEDTIGHYEEEINRQRRLLNITQNLQIKLHRIDLQQQHIYKEQEVFTDHLYCKRETNFCLDQKNPEDPQIKEAQEKLCISRDWDNPKPPQTEEEQKELYSSQEREQFDPFMEISAHEENDHSEPEPISGQLLYHNSRLAESSDKEGSKHPNSGSTNNLVMKTHDRSRIHSSHVDSSSLSQIHCDADIRKKTQLCDVCGKAFRCNFNLKIHYRIHTGEKPFSCETCGKSFTQSQQVTAHMRTHTGERSLSCKICGQNFIQNGNLKEHMKIHTGEKPYSCKTCEKSFGYKNSLLSHMRVHRDEKPDLCNTSEKI